MKQVLWRAESAWLLAVLTLLILGFWWIPGQDRAALDTFSTAAGGKRAFFSLAEVLAAPVTRMTEFLDFPSDDSDTICVLGPAQYPSTHEWQWLYEWVSAGNSLVFAARQDDPAVDLQFFDMRVVPNARLYGDRADDEEAGPAGIKESTAGGDSKTDSSPPPGAEGKRRRPIFERPEVVTSLCTGRFHWRSDGRVEPAAGNHEVLVSVDGKPQVVRRRLGAGVLIVCSSDYIFTNMALATDDNGLLAYRILEAAAPRGVIFGEWLNFSGSPKIFGLLFDRQIRPVTLQIVLVTVVFAWMGFRRFGPPVWTSRFEHRSITEHAAALGNLHLKAGTGGRSVGCYLEFLRQELRLNYAAGGSTSEALVLARRTGADEGATTKLLAEARQVMQSDRASGTRAATLIRELAVVKNKLTAPRA